MMRKPIQQPNPTPKPTSYQLKLPLAVETRIAPDRSLDTLGEITERLDDTLLE